jgi:dTDP-4-dehydrorhamnose 3,5-epimerase-like enzyme
MLFYCLDASRPKKVYEIVPAMNETVTIEVLTCFKDARGLLFEPLEDALLSNQRNVHVVLSAPGTVRGNHSHTRSTELTTIVGPAHVRLKEGTTLREFDIPEGETWRFNIPPGVVHAFKNTGAGRMVIVSFSSAVHDPTHPDTLRETIL